MVFTRNGKAALVQLLVEDLKAQTAFTIPDKVPSPVPANLAGTVSVTNGSAVVTGTGTAFSTDFIAGDFFFIPGDTKQYRILTVDSATQITLAENYAGTTGSGKIYTRSNFGNYFASGIFVTAESADDGRLIALACGDSTDNEAATNTGLKAEHTDSGLARRGGTDVKTYLVNDEANGRWKFNLETTWTVTSDKNVQVFAACSSQTRGRGLAWIYQKLAVARPVKIGDKVNYVATGLLSGSNTVQTPPANQVVVTFEGLREACRIAMSPRTTRRGEGDVSGDWQTAYTIGGVANRKEKQFDVMAVGVDDGTTLTVARTNTALGSETTTLNLARQSGAGVRGTLRQEADEEPFTFLADSFEVFEGDTVQWAADFDSSGDITLWEHAVFNGTNLSTDPGVMLFRMTEVSGIPMDEFTRHIPIDRIQAT